MTTDSRAAPPCAIDAPPPCPPWCEDDDHLATEIVRLHSRRIGHVPASDRGDRIAVDVWTTDTFLAGHWRAKTPRIELQPSIYSAHAICRLDADQAAALAGFVTTLGRADVGELLRAAAVLIAPAPEPKNEGPATPAADPSSVNLPTEG